MTVAATVALPIATLPEVRQLIDSASRGGRREGVIGLRARLAWAGETEFSHGGSDVRVVLCGSALAVRDALRGRREGLWLVIITERDEADLGTGILAHFRNQALRNPDPWGAVREQFAATRIDRRLVTHPSARDLASGFLAARGDQAWLPARGGLLTYDHAFGALTGRWFDLGPGVTDPVIDDVLRWSAKPGQQPRIADLRAAAGDALADAALTWLAHRCEPAAELVVSLVRQGRLADLLPLGLAGRAVLACPVDSAPWVRLQTQHLEDRDVDSATLTPYVEAAELVLRELMLDPGDDAARQVGRLLTRADELVSDLRAEAGVSASELLRSSLTARLAVLGEALHRAVDKASARAASGGDAPLADADRLPAVEAALNDVTAHALAREEERVRRATAGVRLARWLALDTAIHETPALPDLMRRHRDADAWVDRAYGDAWRGVDVESLARGLAAVAAAVRLRRDHHDRQFGAALAAATEHPDQLPQDVVGLEDLVSRVVVPLARVPRPVLLVIADGMSAAVGTEVVDDIERRYDSWLECLPDQQDRRMVGVAVLPSLTKVSRCSLLSGTLVVGEQQSERTGFESLMKGHGLSSALFHKLTLETSGAGTDLAPDVRAAVDNVEGVQVVACVLNTIDDALDRSDPGIDWTADAVAHLRPLLEQARRSGRTVVLTSDHGHVIERRDEDRMQKVSASSSNRSRPFDGNQPGEGEVRVRGRRVLMHDGDAVLAVDERLRYGPLKAGYHGGAAPAEVVVPVHVLASGEPPAGWRFAVPQAPTWWRTAVPDRPAESATPAPTAFPTAPADTPTLFDEVTTEPSPATTDLASRVVSSEIYAEQRQRAQRVTLSDGRIEALLRLLLAAPDHRADATSAAAALGVARVQLGGALPMAQRLLNVEQYPVLDKDPDGSTIVLDPDLLREQFGVGA